MEELSETNKSYITSFRLWVKSQELNRQEVENEINHCQKRKDLEEKQAAVFKERLENNISYTESSIKDFEDWCKENDIDPEIKL